MNIQKFQFDDVEIEFDLRQGKNVMVNATEMLGAFPNKRMSDFVSNQNTEDFILECLKNGNSRFLGVEKRDDLIVSIQKSGTWMHRVLALKFAAWLSPKFEVWVYITIDQILYEYAHEIEDSISETVKLQREQDVIKNKLAKENPDFMKYLSIQQQMFNSKNRRRTATMNKFKAATMDLFSQKKEEE